ncbi:ribonuclease HII [Clostridium fallax]|uniref:Ribonuclease HII n=1 Tax=Clostridium fallax TaxID=1533 RepID=A0A1M4UWX5_9CLOT|nr:ribonuclease HII [Clostridium fallax]SHE61214.1 RNase HII [Clostridium fallax]SQB06803.1 ribonuclease HII [Clostridium fallax]
MEEKISFLINNREKLNFKEINEIVSSIEINKKNEILIREICNELLKDTRKNIILLREKILKRLDKYLKEVERVKNMYLFDKSYGDFKYVAGVDEVGRGPLAGPIVAAAVVLDLDDLNDLILEINDSKKLSEKKRKALSKIIKEKAVSYCICEASNNEIDEKGIAYCNNKVFLDSCNGLKVKPDLVLSDGYLIKNFNLLNKSVIKGDTKSASIACASIIAKVYRDELMEKYSVKYPSYDFKQNVGYGTQKHIEAIKKHGPCDIHRMTFLQNIIK